MLGKGWFHFGVSNVSNLLKFSGLVECSIIYCMNQYRREEIFERLSIVRYSSQCPYFSLVCSGQIEIVLHLEPMS